MVLRAPQVFRVREEKARRVRSPARQAEAKKRQECPVARQERRGRVAGVGQPREERDQEPRDDEERSDDPRPPPPREREAGASPSRARGPPPCRRSPWSRPCRGE